MLSKVLDEEDIAVFQHLTDLTVDETDNSFKITFVRSLPCLAH